MKTRRVFSGILLLLLVLSTGYASAAAQGPAARDLAVPFVVQGAEQGVSLDLAALEAATIPDTEVTVLHSEICDRDYQIYVALPPGYSAAAAKPQGYPVVYSLDANWHFGMVTQIVRGLLLSKELRKDVIVVGIGYPTDDLQEHMARRSWDMVPHLGAPAFLGFIQEELIPYIDAHYLTNPRDRTLEGHSYGGLFTLYALFHATETFQRYIAASPALWYGYEYADQRIVFDYEEAYASTHQALPVELFLSVGELEPEEMHGFYMVSNAIEFNQVLVDRNYKRLELEFVIIDDLGHCGSYPGAVSRGLVEVFE